MQAELARQSDAGRAQLDNQHYSSRGMPSQMMDQGLAGLSRQLRSTQGDLTSGMGDSNNRIEGLFNNSLGNLQMFQSPAEITRRAIAGQIARR